MCSDGAQVVEERVVEVLVQVVGEVEEAWESVEAWGNGGCVECWSEDGEMVSAGEGCDVGLEWR